MEGTEFAAAAAAVKVKGGHLAVGDQLRLYGLYKQATQGDCEGGRPAFWDQAGRAKQ